MVTESDLRRAFDLVPVMAVVASADGFFKAVSPAWEAILGYSVDELLSTPYESLIHPDDVVPTRCEVERQLKGQETIRFENRYRHKDGSYRWLQWNAKPARGPLLYAAALDITPRKVAEEALRESEDRFRAFFAQSMVGQSITQLSGQLEANQAFCDMVGYTADELARMGWPAFTHPEDKERTLEVREQLLTGKIASARFSKRYLHKNSSVVWTDVTTVLRRDERGRPLYFMTTMIDVTERKRADEERQHLEAQLHQARRMESVGRLAGGVAHDFNNMLSTILGNAELALEQLETTDPLHQYLDDIRVAAMRSADLTRQLLTFASRQTVTPRVLDVNETITVMLKMLRQLIGENVELHWVADSRVWPVNIDRSQLEQILTNLCVNARDAIADVGRITIEATNSMIDEAQCAGRPGWVPGEYVRVSVSDNGCGMDAETLSHIFEPFFTTKVIGKGTGLGLATVYGAVMQNGGLIDACSTPGVGTTVTAYLPRFADHPSDVPAEAAEATADRGRETVLLVEDEPTILTLTKRMLERQGYTVVGASTPGEAMRRASEHSGEIDLLVTDVVMPETNGRALAKSLVALHPRLRCLFMSGYTADVIAHHGVLDNGVHFIQKPFTMKSLAEKIRETLDSDQGGGQSSR